MCVSQPWKTSAITLLCSAGPHGILPGTRTRWCLGPCAGFGGFFLHLPSLWYLALQRLTNSASLKSPRLRASPHCSLECTLEQRARAPGAPFLHIPSLRLTVCAVIQGLKAALGLLCSVIVAYSEKVRPEPVMSSC